MIYEPYLETINLRFQASRYMGGTRCRDFFSPFLHTVIVRLGLFFEPLSLTCIFECWPVNRTVQRKNRYHPSLNS